MERTLELQLCLVLAVTLMAAGCATVESGPIQTFLPPEVVEIPVVVKPKIKRIIPPGSRIVIMDIAGDCATEVKDALMRRLIDNADYDVLTRENLRQIIGEKELNWAEGDFNTEAVFKVGKLLGASFFVVGRVSFCGRPPQTEIDGDEEDVFNVFAALQIIDLETGKVIVSSANEGKYIPGIERAESSNERPESARASTGGSAGEGVGEAGVQTVKDSSSPSKNLMRIVGGKLGMKVPGSVPAGYPAEVVAGAVSSDSSSKKEEPEVYLRLKAAEDMANGFADKFFARQMWDNVEMWQGENWLYGNVVRYVKLGHCVEGVEFLTKTASRQLSSMAEADVGRYLHNLGVALLCSNQVEPALKKLRSAYRVNGHDTTLNMLGLAGKISEWSLEIEFDEEPEVGLLMRRVVR